MNRQEIVRCLDTNTHKIKRVVAELAKEKRKYDETVDSHIKDLVMAVTDLINILDYIDK